MPNKSNKGAKIRAAASVINKHRVLKNWGVMEADDAEIVANVWIELFDFYDIPPNAYEQLYRRAVDTRIRRIQSGKPADELNAESLIAEWAGEHGLRNEFERARIAKGRTLTGNAQSQCPKCYGTGFEYAKDSSGREIGIKGRCDHIFEAEIDSDEF